MTRRSAVGSPAFALSINTRVSASASPASNISAARVALLRQPRGFRPCGTCHPVLRLQFQAWESPLSFAEPDRRLAGAKRLMGPPSAECCPHVVLKANLRQQRHAMSCSVNVLSARSI
jgi:hypothetical protein